MPTSYEIRAGGDGKNKKQSMADLKLRRLNELNLRLREDLDRPRVTVAQASKESVSNHVHACRDAEHRQPISLSSLLTLAIA